MLGPTHRAFGGLAGVTLAAAAGQPWPMVAMTGIVATATSNGPASPDMDQTRTWRRVTAVLPRGMRRHRGLTHWWGLPVAAWVLVQQLPPDAHWPAYALLAGWVSHLVGDFVFGRLPLLPWGGPSFGVGLGTGGFVETGRVEVGGRARTVLPFGPTRLVIAAALVWVLAGAPGPAAVADAVASLGGLL